MALCSQGPLFTRTLVHTRGHTCSLTPPFCSHCVCVPFVHTVFVLQTPVSGIAQMRVILPEELQHETLQSTHTFHITTANLPQPVVVDLLLPSLSTADETDSFFLEVSAEDAVAYNYKELPNVYDTLALKHTDRCVPVTSAVVSLAVDEEALQYTNGYQAFWLLENIFGGRNGLTFVESGSADLYSSVTELFERYMCWTGVGVEPIVRWASASGHFRPGMLSVAGALCYEKGEMGGFIENVENPYLSGFGGPEEVDSTKGSTVCHHPSNLLAGERVGASELKERPGPAIRRTYSSHTAQRAFWTGNTAQIARISFRRLARKHPVLSHSFETTRCAPFTLYATLTRASLAQAWAFTKWTCSFSTARAASGTCSGPSTGTRRAKRSQSTCGLLRGTTLRRRWRSWRGAASTVC